MTIRHLVRLHKYGVKNVRRKMGCFGLPCTHDVVLVTYEGGCECFEVPAGCKEALYTKWKEFAESNCIPLNVCVSLSVVKQTIPESVWRLVYGGNFLV